MTSIPISVFFIWASATATTTRIPDFPRNVRDPASVKPVSQFDPKLPGISLEPHRGCIDLTSPIQMTIAVVNGGTVDWDELVRHVSVTPVGPGQITAKSKPPLIGKSTLKPGETGTRVIELKDYFTFSGASVYRLDYTRPLPDGRLHVCPPVFFLGEDYPEIDRWVSARVAAGDARTKTIDLLKSNPLFASGIFRLSWAEHIEQEPPVAWGQSQADAQKSWQIDQPHTRWDRVSLPPAVCIALVERSAQVSGRFAIRTTHGDGSPSEWMGYSFLWRLVHPKSTNLNASERASVIRTLVSAQAQNLRKLGLKAISWEETPEPATVYTLIRFADEDDDPSVRLEAIATVARHQKNPDVLRLLHRKMLDPDGYVALQTAIVLCFGSNGNAGFPVILRLTRHSDPIVRSNAYAILVDRTVYEIGKDKAQEVLLEGLNRETDTGLLQRILESLRSYPTDAVRKAIGRFVDHPDARVRSRAVHTLKELDRP